MLPFNTGFLVEGVLDMVLVLTSCAYSSHPNDLKFNTMEAWTFYPKCLFLSQIVGYGKPSSQSYFGDYFLGILSIYAFQVVNQGMVDLDERRILLMFKGGHALEVKFKKQNYKIFYILKKFYRGAM